MKHFEVTDKYLHSLEIAIAERSESSVRKMVENLHPADIVEIFDELNFEQKKFVYLLLDAEKAADVLAELDEEQREQILSILAPDVIARHFIGHMDSDDAADLLSLLPEEKQEEVLSQITDKEQAGDIVDLLNYDEDTAGGLMAKEMIVVNESWTMPHSLREMRKQAEKVNEIHFVYVVDDDNILKGILSLKKMLIAEPNALIAKICSRDIISVRADMKSAEVASIMEKYDLVALPVVDSIGRLLGRITIDDVVDVIRQEAEKDLQMMSGITESVVHTERVWLLTRARLPWLIVGMLGGILGSQIIGLYEGEIQQHAAMAFFIPLIGATGGNVGVQSSSIIVQGLAAETIDFRDTGRRLFKELLVGLVNASVCSSLVFTYNYFFLDSFGLTVSVSAAMACVILFASMVGTLVPMLLHRMKIDPALATGPFITTTNDIAGLFIYLSIGRYLLN